ncbi:hypothetical protein VA7868_00149 [Vibrio aerogenes CECT 7868]|uniref:Glycosyltransferase n=1 Tax=Vibrio aerogenes CECT 7868 TaxID=1216006 RepID=A0A1M5UQK4_9VIBR|nr:MJ1255/VC2487 family glycosyltransferase [Vibrio aerogenes]SHH65176.1 hypothetical protein VA7868_00149 [Vibrio aerogenes CECT 7868]
MKILYGVQGTGNGHTARARAMSLALRQQGVDVRFLFSGREKEKYFSMECFGDYKTRRGLTFITEKGQVNYLKTMTQNNLMQLASDIRNLDVSDYDLVISDFEPVTAWAARQQKKPCIGLSHQNAFRYPVPQKGANWLDKQLISYFAPSDYHLGLHWYHFDNPILPPIVHTTIHETELQPFILVYLPFETPHDIGELLCRFSDQPFICFHPTVTEPEVIENIEWRPLCHPSFQKHLKCCSGVIANGGFELPSEAMSLGKKLLLKPLKGQFEQMSNVATLEMLGAATSMEYFDVSVVREWLNEPFAQRVIYPDVAAAIAEWITQGKWNDSQYLCDQLWKQVNFPGFDSDMTHYSFV